MKILPAGTLVLACLCGAPALALNLGKDIPLANFTNEDLAIFKAALGGTLDKGIDGIPRSWSNPESNAHGEITPTRSFKRSDVPCRTLTVSNNAKGRTASGPFTFCRQASGEWMVQQ
jgi:surface antigen